MADSFFKAFSVSGFFCRPRHLLRTGRCRINIVNAETLRTNPMTLRIYDHQSLMRSKSVFLCVISYWEAKQAMLDVLRQSIERAFSRHQETSASKHGRMTFEWLDQPFELVREFELC